MIPHASGSSLDDEQMDESMEIPLIESSFHQDRAIGLIGLENLGNTCFMNSALQVLANCHPFNKLLFLRSQNLLRSSKVPLSKAYLNLLNEMGHLNEVFPDSTLSRNRLRPPLPSNILDVIRIAYPMFRGYSQHDSQEFMRAFLSDLHDEVKYTPFNESKYPPLPTLNASAKSCGGDPTGDNALPKHGAKNNRLKKRKSKQPSDSGDKKSVNTTPPPSSAVLDVFQGGTVTCVKCLSCQKEFYRNEVFLDLSLPLLSSSSSSSSSQSKSITQSSAASRPHSLLPSPSSALVPTRGDSGSSGLVYWASFYVMLALTWLRSLPPLPLIASYMALFSAWVKSLIWNESIDLVDCLDAYFDTNDLTGENRYFCENCSKLTDGVMHVGLTKLPEFLCLHLKRFRHDFSQVRKIHSPVKFPLDHLSLKKYRHSSCRDKVSDYELASMVCHVGTGRSGHYFAYARNPGDGEWYEFNDTFVRQVTPSDVASLTAEAYVLLYRKRHEYITSIREKLISVQLNGCPPQVAYISNHWLMRLSEFADPGPITNSDFLCSHGALQPLLETDHHEQHAVEIPIATWDVLVNEFGGGPLVTQLHACKVCEEKLRLLDARRDEEMEAFQSAPKNSEYLYVINSSWFKAWVDFVCSNELEPPGPIPNSVILEPHRLIAGAHRIRPGVTSNRYDWLSAERWQLLLGLYGGGPEYCIRNPEFQPPPLAPPHQGMEEGDKQGEMSSPQATEAEPMEVVEQKLEGDGEVGGAKLEKMECEISGKMEAQAPVSPAVVKGDALNTESEAKPNDNLQQQQQQCPVSTPSTYKEEVEETKVPSSGDSRPHSVADFVPLNGFSTATTTTSAFGDSLHNGFQPGATKTTLSNGPMNGGVGRGEGEEEVTTDTDR